MFGIGKWKTEAWEGTVVDKSEIETTGSDYDYTTNYLHIDMGDGKIERKEYAKKFCDRWNVGDRIVKRAGEKEPVAA